MHYTKAELADEDRIRRLNIINSITGIKPANLIGTLSEDGLPNLAIFSSVFHLGSNPALLGFVMRPEEKVPRHTGENILKTGFYTINHVKRNCIGQAHHTSAKFDRGISEFEKCNLTEEYKFDFKAPFVLESKIKIGLKFIERIPVELNGTSIIVGEIEHLILPEQSLTEEGHINLESTESIGISGLNSYYSLKQEAVFPYARPDQGVPVS